MGHSGNAPRTAQETVIAYESEPHLRDGTRTEQTGSVREVAGQPSRPSRNPLRELRAALARRWPLVFADPQGPLVGLLAVVAWAAGLPLEWFRTRSDAEVVADVLAMVGREATVREVHGWTRRQMEMAAEWAVSEHARRMNGGSAPPIPSHVARLPLRDVGGGCVWCADDPRGCGVGRGAGCPAVGIPPTCPCELCTEARSEASRAEERGAIPPPPKVPTEPDADRALARELARVLPPSPEKPHGEAVYRALRLSGTPDFLATWIASYFRPAGTGSRRASTGGTSAASAEPTPTLSTDPVIPCRVGGRCATCARLNGSELRECAVCGVDETLSDTLSTVNVSARCLCAECADEEARAVIAAAERDPDHARLVNEARAASGRWVELLVSCGFLPDDSGPIPTACVVTRLANDLEQRRADRRDLGALLRLLGPSDAVARSSNALARGETMEQAWATWSLDDRQLLSDVLKLDVSTASWELVRGVL